MACCLQSAHEFITNSFPAFVGALASDDAETICEKNNLSFVELVRPFCQLDGTVTIRDPVNPNIVIQVKNWKIRIIDIQAPLPPKILVNRVLNEVVNRSIPAVDLKSKQSLEQLKNSSTHWYDAYRDCFFQLLHPMRHEFIRDFLACIMVVSTKNPDPMHAFAALSSKQNSMQHSTSDNRNSYKWFSSNTLKYYLLLHDVSDGEDKKADAVFQSMKSVYGSHTCFLLQINSRNKVFPNANDEKMSFSDPWSQHIYPFSDETLDVDENEAVNDLNEEVFTSQKDADKREAKIVDELESIEKEIEENKGSPRSLSFNDPLTNMHYNEVLDDAEGDFNEAVKQQNEVHSRPRKMSERTMKLQEYKKSLQQFSYALVTKVGSITSRKERGQHMTLIDQDKIKAFVYEFAVRGLLPHIEKLMRSLSEQIIARKGIHKSLFHATKKWFGGNKPAPTAVGVGMLTGSSYASDAPELLHRKIGDLAFVVQHYELAYNSYHSAKREFNSEHAWMYFAGALEMAAISSFMLGTSQMYPVHYFEACISTYLKTCRMADYATRACLMSTEALKSKDMYPEAAVEFIRLTNEDCDLRSALLLEQAAYCYLHNRSPMIRKYAFHMILAGHRFSKSSQKKHTLRCYINALQIYQNKGWDLAEDHVKFIIGRQSFNLGNLLDSQDSLKHLLTYESQQPPSQQASYLREYLAVFKQNQLSSNEGSLPDLPLPQIVHDKIRCLLSLREAPQPLGTPTVSRTRTVYAGAYTFQKNFSKSYLERWAELEKEIVLHVTGDLPYPFKPYAPCLSSHTDNQKSSIIAKQETFAYEIHFKNPLKIALNLLRLQLLWELEVDEPNKTCVDNTQCSQDEYMRTEVIDNLTLKPAETKAVCLRLKALVSGKLKVTAVKYVLSSASITGSIDASVGKIEFSTLQENALFNVGVAGKQTIYVKGPRLNSTKEEKRTVLYGVDRRLETVIIPSLPLLEVKFEDIPSTLMCGEIKSCRFHFKNIGSMPLKNIYLISNKLNYFSFGENIDKTFKEKNSKAIIQIPLVNDILEPNEEFVVPVNVLGLDISGVHEIDFLFYYEPCEKVKRVEYRLLQQMIRLQTLSALNISSFLHPSHEDNESQMQRYGFMRDSVLSVCIENKSQATSTSLRCVEFSLKYLKAYSRYWNLESLVNLPPDSNMLRPDEICMLHLKLTRNNTKNDGELSISKIKLSDSSDTENDNEIVSSNLFLKSQKTLSEVNSFGLVVCWETFFIDESFSRNVIRGQTHLMPAFGENLDISEERTEHGVTKEITESDKLNSPCDDVIISFKYSAYNQNDFSTSSFCAIPVQVTCLNQSDRQIEFFIETDDKNLESNATWKRSLQWSGYVNRSTMIREQSSATVSLNALATSVGIFSLQNLCLYYLKSDTHEKSFLPVDQSLFLSVWAT